jgi:hypothetical protein
MDNNKQSKIRDYFHAKRLLKKAFKADPSRFTMWRVARYVDDLRTLKLDEVRLDPPPPPVPLVRQQALDRSWMLLVKKMLKSKL